MVNFSNGRYAQNYKKIESKNFKNYAENNIGGEFL